MRPCYPSILWLAVVLIIGGGTMGILGCSSADRESKAPKEVKKGPPLSPQAMDHFRQAHKFLAEQKLEEALKEFQETHRLAPDSPLATFWLGKALFYKKDREQAEKLFKKVLEMDPQNYHAMAALGRLYSFDLNKLEQAESYLKQALDYSPDNLEAHFDLGRIYALKGEKDKAVLAFRYIFAQEAEFFIYHYEFGRILEAWGEKARALQEYRRAQVLNPKFDLAAQAIKRLEEGFSAPPVSGGPSSPAAKPPAKSAPGK